MCPISGSTLCIFLFNNIFLRYPNMICCVAQSGNVILIARSLLESTFREPQSVGARRLFFASCNHVWGHARMCERPPIVVCYFSEAVGCDFQ